MATHASTPGASGGLAATTFFSKTYDETYALLVEARDYMIAAQARRRGGPGKGLADALETLRLTTRLTQIMAWLLVQRAVHAGEIGQRRARAAAYRLGGHRVCGEAGGEDSAAVPSRLRKLLERSRKLYQRVTRLDEMIGRQRDWNA